MIYEVKNNNTKNLYEFYVSKGYKRSIEEFNEELFNLKKDNKKVFSYSKTIVAEEKGEIVAFIQYGRTTNNTGLIRLFYYKDGFEDTICGLILKASSYFYMFHIKMVDSFVEEYKIDGIFEGVNSYYNFDNIVKRNSFKNIETSNRFGFCY